MNRTMWRQLASGLLAATLSLGIAACDDDTSSGTGDMAVGADMSAEVDMSGGGTPGNGQLTLADVVGTVFSPALPNGSAPRTHTLVAVASLPKVAGTPDPSSNFGVTPTIHGCSIYRYTATNLPGADGDAGDVTFTGFNTATTIGVNAANGSKSPSPMSGSSPITCKRDTTSMLYGCKYNGAANPDSGEAGAPVSSVIYPLIQHRAYCASAPTVSLPLPTYPDQWPYGQPACVERIVGALASAPCNVITGDKLILTACEQEPILPLGVATITQTMAGGADWPAATNMLGNGGGTDGGTGQLAGPLYVVSVTSGTTEISGTDPVLMSPSLSMADGAIDPAKDLTITYSCDPNNLTAGAGCTGTQDLVGLLITTSTNKKVAFSAPSTATGSATCSQPVAAPGGTIKVLSAQLTAMLGGQSNGSIQVALVRLSTKLQSPAGNHPLLAFTAGMGVFGFTDQ